MHSYVLDPDALPVNHLYLEESNKVISTNLDDTDPLICDIESYQHKESYVEYVIVVHRSLQPSIRWRVLHRYRDFDSLHTSLGLDRFHISLPAKKMFGNTGKDFIEGRRQSLQVFLDSILAHPFLSQHIAVKRFLDPVNYPLSVGLGAVESVEKTLRGSSLYVLGQLLPGLGWRVRRLYAWARRVGDTGSGARLLMSWSPFGPDHCLSLTQTNLLIKCIASIECPNIQVHEHCRVTTDGVLCVTPFCAGGSLRDLVSASRPGSAPALYKMADRVTSLQHRCALFYHDIRVICRQILDALHFLHEHGFPYGHLHSGNVLYESGVCRLTELENIVWGVPSLYRSYLVRHKRLLTPMAADVYGFGHILYELTFGQPLLTDSVDDLPNDLLPELGSVIRSVLSAEALRTGLPSVGDLLKLPMFADVVPPLPLSFRCRQSAQAREAFSAVRSAIEHRLQVEHKQYRLTRRLHKTEALLNDPDARALRQQKLLAETSAVERSESGSCSAES